MSLQITMTRIWLIGLVFICFFGIFSLAFAQEARPEMPMPSPTSVEYTLPYPGILPDHPLYIFKSFRDWLLFVLITSPERKVEFTLLTADKHLNMSIFLMNKNQKVLALKTLTRGVDLLSEADKELTNIHTNQPGMVANLRERHKKSLAKHLEIVTGFRPEFQNEVSRIDILLKKLSQM